jgi:hypothetical protein
MEKAPPPVGEDAPSWPQVEEASARPQVVEEASARPPVGEQTPARPPVGERIRRVPVWPVDTVDDRMRTEFSNIYCTLVNGCATLTR